jgi:hypothetical protein
LRCATISETTERIEVLTGAIRETAAFGSGVAFQFNEESNYDWIRFANIVPAACRVGGVESVNVKSIFQASPIRLAGIPFCV